jgi:uncharacterized protein (DUF2236 family)
MNPRPVHEYPASIPGPPKTARADRGLFGPSCVTWHLHADPAMWIGGISSLHLQALHPIAALGIAQNSSFARDPHRRLEQTGRFIVTTTWGTTAEAERAGARIRAIHARMTIRDPARGTTRRVDDPELLLWVHCTLVHSNLHTVRRAGFALSAVHADRYVREQRRTAELVGLPAADAPATVADLRDYLAGRIAHLAVADEARTISRFLLHPPLRGGWRITVPAWHAASRLGYSVMPAWARDLYGRAGWPDAKATSRLRAARRAALSVPWRARLAFPEPVLRQAVQRLGQSAVPTRTGLPDEF